MFATKGRLIATICTVGFLVASWGMYVGVQVQEAEAHLYTWLEMFGELGSPSKFHKEYTYKWSETTTVAIYTWKVKCSVCGKDTITKQSTEKRKTNYERKGTDHYTFSWEYIENCHDHGKKAKGPSTLSWSTTTSACSNSSCGG